MVDLISGPGSILLYLVLLLVVAAEHTAGVGLFVPGVSAAALAGFGAAEGRLSLTVVVLVVWTGATAGDALSYWIGRTRSERPVVGRYTRQVLDLEPLTRNSLGRLTLLLYAFNTVSRYTTPLSAGMTGWTTRRWVSQSVPGLLLFTLTIVGAGYIGGLAFDGPEGAIGLVGTIATFFLVPTALTWWRNWGNRKAADEDG